MPRKRSKESLDEERQSLVNYLNQKIKVEDWHGVADAAMDLREVDAKIWMLEGEK